MRDDAQQVTEHVVTVVDEVGDLKLPTVVCLVGTLAAEPNMVWCDTGDLEKPVMR